jgi:hypothetical protein
MARIVIEVDCCEYDFSELGNEYAERIRLIISEHMRDKRLIRKLKEKKEGK